MKQFKMIYALLLAFLFASLIACSSTSHRSGGDVIDDTVITAKVKAAILKEDTLKSSEINVETYNGVVQLSGFVSSEADIATAAKVAGQVDGVTSVKNDMRLKPK